MARLFLLLAPLLAAQDPTDMALAVSHDVTVKVSDPGQAADALVAAVEKLGGYFSARNDAGVSLRVPVARVPEVLALIPPMGTVVAENSASRDLGPMLEQWRTLLGSRTSVLQRYFAVIGEAGPDAVVTVEREMTALVQQIEQLKGQIQLAEHQLALAQIDVRFEFRDRRAPARDGSSSFSWLNGLNLVDLVEEFGHD